MSSKEFSQYTLEFCNSVSKKEKQDLGKYPTPYSIVKKLFDKVQITDDNNEFKVVMEPSHGTGQIIDVFIDKDVDYCNFYCYEIDEDLHNNCKENEKYKDVEFILGNFLDKKIDISFDYILANPPYFEIKDKELVKKYKKDPKFKSILSGKVNIFCLFLKKCLDLLADNGHLSFIIPVSFMNGRYYEPLRKYIAKNFNIINIEIIDKHDFIDTQIEVMILTIKNEENDGKYIVKKDKLLIFSLDWKKVQTKLDNYLNIKEIGGKVSTGSMVWNQHKEHLVRRRLRNVVPIIYSENINKKDNKIVYKDINKENGKRQYVQRSWEKWEKNDKKTKKKIKIELKVNKGPAIVVNRIVGAKNIKLTCAKVEKDHEFVGENHVNVITHPKDDVLNEIYEVLNSQDTLEYIKSIRGNVQLSQSDLQNLVPIRKKGVPQQQDLIIEDEDDEEKTITITENQFEELLELATNNKTRKTRDKLKKLILEMNKSSHSS